MLAEREAPVPLVPDSAGEVRNLSLLPITPTLEGMNARRPLASCVAVSALLFGCVLSSPDFDDPALGTGTTDTDAETSVSSDPSGASMSTTSGTATDSAGSESNSASQGVTSEPTEGTATEGTGTGTTSDVTSDNTGTGTTDDTTGTTTGGVEPGTYNLSPTVSTCVFLANQNGPYSKQACLNSAEAQIPENNVIIVDTAVNMRNGQGRRAEGYFKFSVPAEFEGASISSVTLRVETPNTPYAPAPEGGQLVLMGPYTEGSLDSQVPNILQDIGPKQGQVPNQPVWMEWSVDPNLLTPGEALHLGLVPTNGFGVFYRKNEVFLRVIVQ